MKISAFRPATKNANRHTARGLKALQDSMRSVGYTEPMVAAADGEMLSGTARLESVADVFGVEVEPIIVRSDGKRPIIHVRDDIPNAHTPEAQQIALAANRIAQLDLDWDVAVIASMDAATIGDLWTPAELSDLGQAWARKAEAAANDPNAEWEGMPEFEQEDLQGIIVRVHFENEAHRTEFFTKLGVSFTDKTNSFWYPERPEELRNQLGTGLRYSES